MQPLFIWQVGWLIAKTNAALGARKGDGDPTDKSDVEMTSDKRELSPARDNAQESSSEAATRFEEEGGERDAGVDQIDSDGLNIAPDRRELSPKRDNVSKDVMGLVDEETGKVGADGTVTLVGQTEELGGKQTRHVDSAGGENADGAPSRVASLSFSSPEKALTASPSPELRVRSSSPVAAGEEASATIPTTVRRLGDGGDGEGKNEGEDQGASVPPSSSEQPAVEAAVVSADVNATEGAKNVGDDDEGQGSKSPKPPTDAARVEPNSDEERRVNITVATSVTVPADPVEDSSVGSSIATPAVVVDDAPVSPAVDSTTALEEVAVENKGQQKDEEEENERPALDAVVESVALGGDRPVGKDNGDVILGTEMKEALVQKERTGGEVEGKAEGNEAGAEQGGGVVGRENDDGARLSAGARGSMDSSDWSAGSSDVDDAPTACLSPNVETDAVQQAGGARGASAVQTGNELPSLAVEANPSPTAGLTVPAFAEEAVSVDVQVAAASYGHSSSGSASGNGLPANKEKEGGGAEVLGRAGAEEGAKDVSTFEDVEL